MLTVKSLLHSVSAFTSESALFAMFAFPLCSTEGHASSYGSSTGAQEEEQTWYEGRADCRSHHGRSQKQHGRSNRRLLDLHH